MKKYSIFILFLMLSTITVCGEQDIDFYIRLGLPSWTKSYLEDSADLKKEGFYRCECNSGSPIKRVQALERFFWSSSEINHSLFGKIVFVSVGSGGCLEELHIIKRLLYLPKSTSVEAYFIDPLYNEKLPNYEKTSRLMNLFKKKIHTMAERERKSASVHFYRNVKDFFKNNIKNLMDNAANSYILAAIDLGSDSLETTKSWEPLTPEDTNEISITTPKERFIQILFGSVLGDISVYAEAGLDKEEKEFIRTVFDNQKKYNKNDFIEHLPYLYQDAFKAEGMMDSYPEKKVNILLSSKPKQAIEGIKTIFFYIMKKHHHTRFYLFDLETDTALTNGPTNLFSSLEINEAFSKYSRNQFNPHQTRTDRLYITKETEKGTNVSLSDPIDLYLIEPKDVVECY